MAQGTEIERKWVVTDPPPGLEDQPRRTLAQGYLAVHADGVEVRLRRDGDRRLLTVKSGPGMVRTEEELELDERRFDALWALTEGRQVVKVRHLVDGPDGTVIEVDVFEGPLEGLVTAEVEFPSEEASRAFVAPGWMGTEVTGDKRFANQRLAVAAGPPVV